MIKISLLSDIKNLLNKYLKNKILVIAGSYLLWRFVKKQKMKSEKEFVSERIKIIDDEEKKPYSIIYDDRNKKYVMIYGDRVFSADSEEELYKILR